MASVISAKTSPDIFVQQQTISELEKWLIKQQSTITSNFAFQELTEIKQALFMIASAKKELELVLKKATTIYNDIEDKFRNRIKIFKRQLHNISDQKESPLNLILPSFCKQNENKHIEFAPGLPANCITQVETLGDIPDMRLYWVNDVQQFAFKICGFYFRGNIGSIYPSIHTSNRNVIKINECRYGKTCRNIQTAAGCNFYHDPLHLPASIETKSREIRNYTNGSWIYTQDPLKECNKMMRHIGDRESIAIDLPNVSSQEASSWVDQHMHTFLVTLLLYLNGKIPTNEPIITPASQPHLPGLIKKEIALDKQLDML
jgi:hypothetical protein